MPKRLHVFFVCALFYSLIFFASLSAQTLPDTVRLLCIGNSITEGWMTQNPLTDAYPVQLGSMLGGMWHVMNAGVSGRTMLRRGDYPIWNEQKFKNGLAFNPNIVTVLLGTNDSKPWNWDTLKDEFIDDYKAMIDTLRTLPSNPVIWLGLPAPAFHDTLGIRDSIITTDIIPMIQQVALDKGCPIIGINEAMKSYRIYSQDGIHPNTTGSEAMAEVFYSTLTRTTIRHIRDENCASGKTVTVSGSIDTIQFGGNNLVDGDRKTVWTTTGFNSSAVIDLGSIQKIDLFQLNFGDYAVAGYKFSIEAAKTSGSWNTIVDSTTRRDSAVIILIKTDSIDVQYVRLKITGAIHPRGDTISIADFSVVKSNGGAHAPAILINRVSATKTYVKYNLFIFWPVGVKGAVMIYQRAGSEGTFLAITGFKAGSSSSTLQFVKVGNINAYYAVSFMNGVITASDTIIVNTNTTAVMESGTMPVPEHFVLQQCYPNPFNPTTTISFSLASKSYVTLKVFDILGREVATLANEELSAGNHTRQWNAINMSSGVYFYKLETGLYSETKKLVLLR